MSSSKIKPMLNTEILYGILEKFEDFGSEECSRSLIKFMLSGREPCRAVFDYFSKATRVSFHVQTLCLVVMNNIYSFGYDWEFLNIFLKVAIPSVNDLSIIECPGSERGFEILDRFLKPDLKSLTLLASVPSRYMKFFKDDCNFEQVDSQHLNPHNPSVLDIFTIPSAEHCLIFAAHMDFIGAVPFLLAEHSITEAGVDDNNIKIAPTETYPAVKKLDLNFFNYFEGNSYTVSSLFPNLRSINAKYQSEGPWQNFIENFLSFSTSIKQSKIEANFTFTNYDADGRFEEVLYLKETNPEIHFNEHDAMISKSYEIRDGGFAHFVIMFGGKNLITDNNNGIADDQNNVVEDGQNYQVFFAELFNLIIRVILDIASNDLRHIPLFISFLCRMYMFLWFIDWISDEYFGFDVLKNYDFTYCMITAMLTTMIGFFAMAEDAIESFPQVLVTLNIWRLAIMNISRETAVELGGLAILSLLIVLL